MSDSTTPQDSAAMSPASAGSVAGGSLAAYLKWRDEKIASGESDVNPFMVWCAGVRYATLTDAEREDLQMWLAECLRQGSAATAGGNDELAERWQGRANRAAAMLERMK